MSEEKPKSRRNRPSQAGQTRRTLKPAKPINELKVTKAKKLNFIDWVVYSGLFYEACAKAGLATATCYEHMRCDPEFAMAYEEALAKHREKIEAAVRQRGVEGYEEPVIHGGRIQYRTEQYEDGTYVDEKTGEEKTRILDRLVLDENGNPIPLTVRKFSDRMTELYAKRHIPEYRDKVTVDQNTNLRGSLEVAERLDLKGMTREQRDALRVLMGGGAAGQDSQEG